MILHDRIAAERILPAIVTRIGTGLRRVGLKPQQIAGDGLPATAILALEGIGQWRGGVPEHHVGSGARRMVDK